MPMLQIVGDKPLEKDESLEARLLRIENSENRIKKVMDELRRACDERANTNNLIHVDD